MQQDYWDKIAGPVWAASQVQMDAVLRPYAETLREAACVVSGASIVDVGCGCGATTLMAAEVSPQASIVGLDVSGPMLAVAKQRARKAELAKTRFVHGDAASYPVAAGSVDRILSRFGVMFFGDPTSAFAHMGRWLSPEGRMVVVVWGPREKNRWMTDMVRVLARHLPVAPPDPDTPGPFSLGEAAKRHRVFSGAGLNIIEELELTAPVRIEGSIEDATNFYSQRGPLALLLAEAEPEVREAALADLRHEIEARHDGHGITMPANAIRVTLAK